MSARQSQRRVHFVDDPSPQTPSPSYSTTSLLSSPGPITPRSATFNPDVQLPPTPYIATIPLNPLPSSSHRSSSRIHTPSPPQALPSLPRGSSSPSPYMVPTNERVLINALLASTYHAKGTERPFTWNLSYPSENARGPPSHNTYPNQYSPFSLSPEMLAQSATSPSLPEMTVRCTFLPWKITIKPSGDISSPASTSSRSSSRSASPFVTVGDVLRELYTNLRVPLTHNEFESICSAHTDGTNLKKNVETAYFARCDRERDAQAERGKGIKRVDMLMRYLDFSGLMSNVKWGEFTLHVGPVSSR